MYRIKEVAIKDFRGFREAHFPIPDVDIVLVAGGNGFGKSSFFDAMEWGLTGSLRRYAESSQEKNSEIFLTNRYSTGPGQVKIVLSHGADEMVVQRRTEIRRGNDFNDGKLAGITQQELEEGLVKEEFVGKYDFTRGFNFSHLLSQELIDEFVRGFKATDRYDVLSHLIGIQDYANYTDRFRLLEREVRQPLDTLHLEILTWEKDQEKYEALVQQEQEGLGGLEGRWEKLTDQWNQLIPAVYTNLDERQQHLATQANHPELLHHIRTLHTALTTRIRLHRNQYQTLIKLLAQFPSYQSKLREREQVEQEREELKERLQGLKRLATLDGIRTHLELYQNRLSLEREYDALNNHWKQLEIGLQIFRRNELGLVDKLYILETELHDPLLQEYANQMRAVQAELREVEEQWNILNKMQEQLGQMEMDILQRTVHYFVLHPHMEHCPVCRTAVDPQSLVQQLKERIELEKRTVESEQVTHRERLYEELLQVRKRYAAVVTVTQHYLDTLESTQREEWSSIVEKKFQMDQQLTLTNRVQEELTSLNLDHFPEDEIAQEIEVEYSALKAQIDSASSGLTPFRIERRLEELERTESTLVEQIVSYEREINTQNIAEVHSIALETALHSLETEIAAMESQIILLEEMIKEGDLLFLQTQNSLNRQKLQSIQTQLIHSREKAIELEKLRKDLKDLQSAVPTVLKTMTLEVLNLYKQTVNTFLHLLNPQPFFTQLDWEISQSSFNHGTLVLQSISADGQYRMNPSYTYSAAQINLIALSFFLGFAVQQHWSKLQCIFMDDPIQNMDDINIFGFVDVIRALCLNGAVRKQIFISTHDRKFINFMLKKFRMLRVFVLDYKGYGENGPVIETKMVEPTIALSRP